MAEKHIFGKMMAAFSKRGDSKCDSANEAIFLSGIRRLCGSKRDAERYVRFCF